MKKISRWWEKFGRWYWLGMAAGCGVCAVAYLVVREETISAVAATGLAVACLAMHNVHVLQEKLEEKEKAE